MFFILFSIEFVANHALLVALNLSRIMHFSCKFLCSKKAAGVNVLPYSNSVLFLIYSKLYGNLKENLNGGKTQLSFSYTKEKVNVKT